VICAIDKCFTALRIAVKNIALRLLRAANNSYSAAPALLDYVRNRCAMRGIDRRRRRRYVDVGASRIDVLLVVRGVVECSRQDGTVAYEINMFLNDK